MSELGAGVRIAAGTLPPPETITIAKSAIYGYVRDLYHRMGYERMADFETRGEGWPSVAYPIEIVTLTAAGAHTEGFAEPTLEAGDKLLESMRIAISPKRDSPHGFVTGSIVFEVPIGDQRLQVLYATTFSGYTLATWELY